MIGYRRPCLHHGIDVRPLTSLGTLDPSDLFPDRSAEEVLRIGAGSQNRDWYFIFRVEFAPEVKFWFYC